METVEIRALGSEGQGIAELSSGKTVFVEGLLPGERAEISILQERLKIAFGQCTRRLNDSPDRREPVCELYGECGGCSLMHMSPELCRAFKKDKDRDALIRIGRFDPDLIDRVSEDLEVPEDAFHYRNHMQYAVSGMDIGLKARGSCEIKALDECLLEYEEFTKIRRLFENVFKDHPTSLFTGLILRGSKRTREFLVELVSEGQRSHELLIRDSREYLAMNRLPEKLGECLGEAKLMGILLQICPDRSSRRQRSGKRVILEGCDYFHELLLGKTFRIKAGAFFQVNTKQAEKLYSKVKEYVSDSKVVYDLFCGTGSIGISCVSPDRSLYGIEISEEAVRSAKINAELNHMKNARFTAKPAERFDFASQGLASPDTIIVDPPRKGMDIALIEKIRKLAAPKIVYVSCDPATLARDLKYLSTDYEIKKISTFDMFFWTEHVETVVLLSKGIDISAGKLRVEISVEDMDLSAAHGNASYNKIKKHVYEKTGLQVSNLNIAQVKRKYGIIERENYNLPKSENTKQPNCTPEKEKAIVAALQYFKMIG